MLWIQIVIPNLIDNDFPGLSRNIAKNFYRHNMKIYTICCLCASFQVVFQAEKESQNGI